MRNVTRTKKDIAKVLKGIEKAWLKRPDMRFGQLISNAAAYGYPDLDLFYLEDKDFLKALDLIMYRV